MQHDQQDEIVPLRSRALSLSTAIAQSVELFLHYGRGADSLFTGGALGIAFLAVFEFWMVMLFPHDNPYPLPVFAAAYMLLCIWHRLSAGRKTHIDRLYTGRPIIALVLRFEEGFAKAFEPILVFVMGCDAYRAFSRPLGLYLMLAGLMLLIYILRAIARERSEARHREAE